MTGLETILNQINDDAKREADEQLAAAKIEADKIIAEAKQQAAKLSAEIIAEGEVKAAAIRERAESAAQLQRRNTMLAFKQQIIHEVIDKARTSLENAATDEYFEVLLLLVARFAANGSAEMRMNQRDLDRMPSNFADRVKTAAPAADITISPNACEIDSGFILVYGGIDINCTFSAIFEDAEGELRDAVGKLLFPAV